jgi:hypothetical protein
LPTFTVVSYPQATLDSATSRVWTGYYKPDETGNHTFSLRSDDGGAMWINGLFGPELDSDTAVSSHFGLHDIASGNPQDKTVSLISGQYYPITILQGNQSGPGGLQITVTTPTTTYSDSGLVPYYFKEKL